jgi:hypothetical protein
MSQPQKSTNFLVNVKMHKNFCILTRSHEVNALLLELPHVVTFAGL